MLKRKKQVDFWFLTKICIFLFVCVTILYPISTVVIRSITNSDGQVTIQNFVKFFNKKYYIDVTMNTLFVASVTTVFSIIIGVFLAYVMTRYDIKAKKFINILVILSLMSPPFIGAYAWIMLFGRSGVVTELIEAWFGITMPTIYGKWGIISVFTMKMYPYVYLFTSGALGSIDASLEEAAENLGASKWQRMKDITIPVVLPSILGGAVMAFTSCISDFGTPMLIGQNYKVLATLVYEQYMSEVGTSSNFAAAVSMVVVLLSALVLIFQNLYINRRNYNMSALRPPQTVHLRIGSRIAVMIPVCIILLISMLPQIVVIVTSFKNCNGPYFVAGWSFESYQVIFTRMIRSIKNTYMFSIYAIILMVVFGSLTAYVTVRKRNIMTHFTDVVMMFPYVIPGAIMGLSYIIAFNRRPFFLAGEEFGRTKGGIKNSFCSSSEVNQLDWTRAWKNRDLVDYYRGLIALRMQMPGVCDKSADAHKRVLWVKELAKDCVMACVDNKGKDSKWEQILMIFNCSDCSGNAQLPAGNWQILADGENSFCWKKEDMVCEKVRVAEFSAMILGRK